MHLNSDEKIEIFEKYGKGKTDTGSPEAQIALFSVRIAHLTNHLKSNHKDHTTARALKALVGKRRRLLDYLIKKDIIDSGKKTLHPANILVITAGNRSKFRGCVAG